MKKSILLTLPFTTLLLATACTKEKPEPAVITSSQPPAECPEQQRSYMPFPAGVNPALAYHLRDDRIYVHTNGVSRRRITMEYLEGDAAGALASFTDAMIKGGFKASAPKQIDQGRTSVSLSKKGLRGVAHLTLNPSAGPKPRNPAAKGVLTLDYPVADNVNSSSAVTE